ncbi:hypothetical protein Bca4012_045417 [Brassica carinata]
MGMTHNNPFSMPTLFEALQRLRLSEEETSGSIPPPPALIPRAAVDNARLIKLFNLMTSKECVSQFKEIISKEPDPEALPKIVSLLTSDSDYFMEVVRNKYGSKRVQKLLGISDDVDALFYAAILRRFYDIMTDKYASYVAIRAMLVFDTMEKFRMYDHVLYYALDIARDQYGCSALNEVITDVGDALYRKLILDLVACNALFLSNDPSGNFVVQHVLTLYDSRCTKVWKLHCREASGGGGVDGCGGCGALECEGGRLTRLARNEFGSFVVVKALRVTQEMDRTDMFWDLVQKLMPLRHLLVRSHGSNIAKILESCSI